MSLGEGRSSLIRSHCSKQNGDTMEFWEQRKDIIWFISLRGHSGWPFGNQLGWEAGKKQGDTSGRSRSWTQACHRGGGEKWLGVGSVLEIQPVRCARKEPRMTGRFLAWATGRTELPWTEMRTTMCGTGLGWEIGSSDLGTWSSKWDSNNLNGEYEALNRIVAVEMDKELCI